MKKLLLIYLTVMPFFAWGQYSGNGTSTNPANPRNPIVSSMRNDFFDWQLENWAVQPNDCTNKTEMESPFFKIDNLEELRAG